MVNVRMLLVRLAINDFALTWIGGYSVSGVQNWLLVPVLAITISSIFYICSISCCCLWMSCCCASYCSACVWMSCYCASYCSAYVWMNSCCNSYCAACVCNRQCCASNNSFNSPISSSRPLTCDSGDGIIERQLDLRGSALGTPPYTARMVRPSHNSRIRIIL